MKNNKDKTIVIFLAVLLLISITAVILLGQDYLSANSALKVQTVYNFFTDINGDGNIDYVKDANVIINTGGINFLAPQP